MRIVALAALCASSGGAWAACTGQWVDIDTQSDACLSVSEWDGQELVLVFSDEFERPGRTFIDGHDARWTGLDSAPSGNEQVNYYNASLARTVASELGDGRGEFSGSLAPRTAVAVDPALRLGGVPLGGAFVVRQEGGAGVPGGDQTHTHTKQTHLSSPRACCSTVHAAGVGERAAAQ